MLVLDLYFVSSLALDLMNMINLLIFNPIL